MTILITGNPVDGFTYYGPFKDGEEAFQWADNNRLEEWWVTNLHTPPRSSTHPHTHTKED